VTSIPAQKYIKKHGKKILKYAREKDAGQRRRRCSASPGIIRAYCSLKKKSVFSK
jgi:hypothetical protein